MDDALAALGLEALQDLERGLLGNLIQRAQGGDLAAMGILVDHLARAKARAEETARRRQGGRRTKLTPELAEEFLAAVRGGASNKVACDLVGICENTLYRWMQEAGRQEELAQAQAVADGMQPDEYSVVEHSALWFREEIARAKAALHRELLGDVLRQSHQGNHRASAWLMERKFPHEYRDGHRQHDVRVSVVGDADLRARMVAAGLVPDAPPDGEEDPDGGSG